MDYVIIEKIVINYLVYVKKLPIDEATELYNSNAYYFNKVFDCIGDDLVDFLLSKIAKAAKIKSKKKEKI